MWQPTDSVSRLPLYGRLLAEPRLVLENVLLLLVDKASHCELGALDVGALLC